VRSIQATIGLLLVLLLLSAGYQWVVYATLPLAGSGITLSPAWRVALASCNWFSRYNGIITIVGFPLAAGIGALASRRTAPAEERRLLLYWVLLSIPGWLLLVAASSQNDWMLEILIVLVGLDLVQPVASTIVAAHLQSRASKISGSRVDGWCVVGAAGILYAIRPHLVALPCLWVWWQSGKAAAKEHREVTAGSVA
jgi:hypothetical protein